MLDDEDTSAVTITEFSEDLPPLTGSRSALGASVSADFEALKNDVEQAKILACEYQQQLAGKANELATLKHLFEKTSEDFAHLNEGITKLREERHDLANKAMCMELYKNKAERAARERDNERKAYEERLSERDVLIAQLRTEIDFLKGQFQKAGRAVPVSQSSPVNASASEFISIAYAESESASNVTVVPDAGARESALRRLKR